MILCIVLVLQLAASAPTTNQSTIEQQPIRRADTMQARNHDASSSGSTSAPGGLDVQRVLLALAIVLGLIIVLWALARWLFPGVAAARSSSAVRVLSRSVISPKQQILMVQVGRRLIVVGDSGTQMSPLAQIDDAEEVAELRARLESEKQPATRAFRSIFRRERDQFDEHTKPPARAEQDLAPNDLGYAQAGTELSGLIERVRTLAQQFRKS